MLKICSSRIGCSGTGCSPRAGAGGIPGIMPKGRERGLGRKRQKKINTIDQWVKKF